MHSPLMYARTPLHLFCQWRADHLFVEIYLDGTTHEQTIICTEAMKTKEIML